MPNIPGAPARFEPRPEPELERVSAPSPLPPSPLPPSPLAPSLRGSEIDGGLAVDRDGHFVPDREALALFDYFLSARGEVDDAEISARIRSEITTRLGQPARDEALAFFDDYLAYRAEARQLAESPRIAAAGDLERRFQWIRELRRKHFGAKTADALFGDEEAMVLASIESRRVSMDPDLSDDERASRFAAIEDALPESIRESRRRTRAPVLGWQHESAMRAEGASAAEIHAYREQTFGPEAAARLAELDQDRESRTR